MHTMPHVGGESLGLLTNFQAEASIIAHTPGKPGFGDLSNTRVD
jgi:hypothetical protein